MPVFCSSHLESSKDYTDKGGNTVRSYVQSNNWQKGWSFGVFQSKCLLFLYDLAAFCEKSAQKKRKKLKQMEACKCLEQWI